MARDDQPLGSSDGTFPKISTSPNIYVGRNYIMIGAYCRCFVVRIHTRFLCRQQPGYEVDGNRT